VLQNTTRHSPHTQKITYCCRDRGNVLLLSACSTAQLYFLVIFHGPDVQGFDKCFEACDPGRRFSAVTGGCSGKGLIEGIVRNVQL